MISCLQIPGKLVTQLCTSEPNWLLCVWHTTRASKHESQACQKWSRNCWL